MFLLVLGDDRDVEKLRKSSMPFKIAPQSSLLWSSIYGTAFDTQIVPNPTYKQNYRKYFDYL
jgi:hypothetical protein